MRTHCEIIVFCIIPELPAVLSDNRGLRSTPTMQRGSSRYAPVATGLERGKVNGEKEKTVNRFVERATQTGNLVTLFHSS